MKKISRFVFLLPLCLIYNPAIGADDSSPPVNRISMAKARATALKLAPGKVRDFEFEIRKDKWVYFFKIAGKDQKYHHIVVDALTGKIVSKSSESMPAGNKAMAAPSPSVEPSLK